MGRGSPGCGLGTLRLLGDKEVIVAIDFDGTIARENWPHIGDPIPGAFDAIAELSDARHCLILNTCREDKKLAEAKNWLHKNNVLRHFSEFNENDATLSRFFANDSRKIGADVYIDDKGIGCPKKSGIVDWKEILKLIALVEENEK